VSDPGRSPIQNPAGIAYQTEEAAPAFLNNVDGDSEASDLVRKLSLVKEYRRKLQILELPQILEKMKVHHLGTGPKISGDDMANLDHGGQVIKEKNRLSLRWSPHDNPLASKIPPPGDENGGVHRKKIIWDFYQTPGGVIPLDPPEGDAIKGHLSEEKKEIDSGVHRKKAVRRKSRNEE
jgi:hypothetical protein